MIFNYKIIIIIIKNKHECSNQVYDLEKKIINVPNIFFHFRDFKIEIAFELRSDDLLTRIVHHVEAKCFGVYRMISIQRYRVRLFCCLRPFKNAVSL